MGHLAVPTRLPAHPAPARAIGDGDSDAGCATLDALPRCVWVPQLVRCLASRVARRAGWMPLLVTAHGSLYGCVSLGRMILLERMSGGGCACACRVGPCTTPHTSRK